VKQVASLRGMTWNHPRGYDPLVACCAVWKERTGVDVRWDKRSLQDFEAMSVRLLADHYDLIVIDHPHVGQITRENCLLPLDAPDRDLQRHAVAGASVGPSYQSYLWAGRLWALPIDAAAQVQAWRPDLVGEPAADWDAVMALAKAGSVMCPLRPPHSLMAFFTLAANLGTPCDVDPSGRLIGHEEGVEVYRLLGDLAAVLDPECFAMDPIAVLETMAGADARIACAPLVYGYASYARDGFRDVALRFADIPPAGKRGPEGSTLGGTGVAVSASTRYPAECLALAYWLAGEEAQTGAYVSAGGQPAHAAAWEDVAINALYHDFYRCTRKSLDRAWVRPRHDGYMQFQAAAALAINNSLQRGGDGGALVDQLNRLFAKSLPRPDAN